VKNMDKNKIFDRMIKLEKEEKEKERKKNYWYRLSKSPSSVYEHYGLIHIQDVLVSKDIKSFKEIRFFNLEIADFDFCLLGPEPFDNDFFWESRPKIKKGTEDPYYFGLAIYCDFSYRRYTKILIL